MPKSLLDDRALLPAIHLLGRPSWEFDSSNFKRKKNLVIFFITALPKEFLFALEEAGPVLREQNAEIAVICPLPSHVLEALCAPHRITSNILSDVNLETRRHFIQAGDNESVAALFIADKSGEIFFQYVVSDIAELPSFKDIAKSLDFIESQRPECGEGF